MLAKMKTRKILTGTAFAALIIASIVLDVSGASVAVSRDMPSYVSPGANFTVTFTIHYNGSVLGCGITEYYPVGWVVSNLSGGNLRTGPDRIEWIIFTGAPLTDRTLSYLVTVPENASGVVSFSGNVTPSGASNSIISGDTVVTVGPYIVDASRNLPSSGYTNADFTVTLSLDVDESNKPPALRIVEFIPSGLSVTSVSSGGVYFPASSRIEWLFSDSTNSVQDRNITYVVDVPMAGPTGDISFSGVVQVSGSGNRTIGGETTLSIAQGCSARGDVPPCNIVQVVEILDVIQDWAGGNASISDVMALILLWANSL